MGFRRGQTVICIERPDYFRGELTERRPYVVNALERHHGHEYLVILGDDDRKHAFLATMFKKLRS